MTEWHFFEHLVYKRIAINVGRTVYIFVQSFLKYLGKFSTIDVKLLYVFIDNYLSQS